MKLNLWVPYILLIVFFASGCAFQKRVYRKGYYLHRNYPNPSTAKSKIAKDKVNSELPGTVSIVDSMPLLASSDNSIILPEINDQRGFDLPDNECGDSLILRSGTVLKELNAELPKSL